MSGPIVVETTVPAPRAEVWHALTDPARMRRWLFAEMHDFEAVTGFETGFDVAFDGRGYPHRWTVLDVEHEQAMRWRWRYDGYPGDSVVTWRVDDVPGGTRVRVEHEGWDTFPEADPAFGWEATRAGWAYFVQERLPAFLADAGELEG